MDRGSSCDLASDRGPKTHRGRWVCSNGRMSLGRTGRGSRSGLAGPCACCRNRDWPDPSKAAAVRGSGGECGSRGCAGSRSALRSAYRRGWRSRLNGEGFWHCAGVPVHIVAARLGDDPTTVLTTYAHLLPQSDELAAERVAALLERGA
jgi:hypothetical protein